MCASLQQGTWARALCCVCGVIAVWAQMRGITRAESQRCYLALLLGAALVTLLCTAGHRVVAPI